MKYKSKELVVNEQISEAVKKTKLPKQAQEGLKKLGEKIGNDEWLELFKEFNKGYTFDQQNIINFKLWLQENYFPPKPKKQ